MFDVGFPEPLAFWVPVVPIKFTTLDNTKITVKLTKADKETNREGHSTDNRRPRPRRPPRLARRLHRHHRHQTRLVLLIFDLLLVARLQLIDVSQGPFGTSRQELIDKQEVLHRTVEALHLDS